MGLAAATIGTCCCSFGGAKGLSVWSQKPRNIMKQTRRKTTKKPVELTSD